MPDDDFSLHYSDLETGSYDCVDRIVLKAFFPLALSTGRFRRWWRNLHGGSDGELDNRAPDADGQPVRPPGQGMGQGQRRAGRRLRRKHRIAEEYLAAHRVGTACSWCWWPRPPAPVFKLRRSANGTIVDVAKKREYVNQVLHIMDPVWGM